MRHCIPLVWVKKAASYRGQVASGGDGRFLEDITFWALCCDIFGDQHTHKPVAVHARYEPVVSGIVGNWFVTDLDFFGAVLCFEFGDMGYCEGNGLKGHRFENPLIHILRNVQAGAVCGFNCVALQAGNDESSREDQTSDFYGLGF